MTCAYDELYLMNAQRMMGDMYDYAANTLNMDLEEFQKMFLVCDISEQISMGNPMYLAGKNGCEVAREVIETCTGSYPDEEDAMYADKSAEYWIGWALAYYQWHSTESFRTIEEVCPITDFYAMYPTLHEADVSVLVEIIDERVSAQRKDRSGLRRLRKYANLTQSALADKADVPLRQIQLFEQGYRDIGKCQARTLSQISHALHCSIEDLI